MKRINFKGILMGVALMSMLATSCKRYSSDFGNTNEDPNNITKPLLNALLTNVLAGIGGYASSTRGGYYCQYFSETQYSDASLYALPQLSYEGNYSGSLMDLQTIINDGSSNNMSQVARILKVYIYAYLTDAWGDVPYSESLKGTQNVYPAYDAQENIYKDMIKELTEAVAAFNTSSAIIGDIVYGGSEAKWKRFANSMRLRLAIQLTKKYPGAADYSSAQFNAALNDPAGLIVDNSDNFVVDYPGGAYQQPWYALYNGRSDVGESDVMVDIMGDRSDNRQSKFGSSNLGVPYGRQRSYIDPWQQANPTWARVLQPDLRTDGGMVTLLPASETYLHRAEAANRGWTAENMSSMYQLGINASFAQWGLAPPSAGYFTQALVNLGAPGAAGNTEKIAIQEYIAAYPDGIRGWNIWRRTGFPVLVPALDAVNTSKQIVRRYTYHQSTYGSNPDATNAAAAAIPGGDTQDSKVWWDR